MRHRKYGKGLGVPSDRRQAMLKQLVEALFLHGRIRTTLSRAKAARPLAERVVTWAKKGTLHHRRLALALIRREDVVHRIFQTVAEWYRNRQGGYTRIVHLGQRPGDGAPMVFFELVDWIPGEKLKGQHTRQEKQAVSQEEKEAQAAKQKKEQKKRAKQKKNEPAKPVKKSKKSPEQEKKISDRKAEKDKQKKERAEKRAVIKKTKTEKQAVTRQKAGSKMKPAGKAAKRVAAKPQKKK